MAMERASDLNEARACVLSQPQFSDVALSDDDFAILSKAHERLLLGARLLEQAIEDPTTAYGLARVAGKQAETVGAVLAEWRDGGLAVASHTLG